MFPTNETPLISGCSQIYLTVSLPPYTTFTTPSGTPDYFKRSIKTSVVPATFSEGFKTYVFPNVIESGYIQSGIIAGKLNGQTPAITPKGTLYEYISTLLATYYKDSPIPSDAKLHECSTTSYPLKISPFASTIDLPCSLHISSAISP